MKAFKKSLCFVLSLALAFSGMVCAVPYFTAEAYYVSYPSRGVTADDLGRKETFQSDSTSLLNVLNKVDGILMSDDFTNLTDMKKSVSQTVNDLIKENLYKDDIITLLVTSIYPAIVNGLESGVRSGTSDIPVLGDISDYCLDIVRGSVDDYDMDIYPEDLADAISAVDSSRFSQIINELKRAGCSWSSVNLTNKSWNVTDRASFIKAVSAALSGLRVPLQAVLQNKETGDDRDVKSILNVDIACEIKFYANDCYATVILPLLETICGNTGEHVSLLNPSSFRSLGSIYDMMYWILNPLFEMVENVIARKPAAVVAEILPQLSYVIKNGLFVGWLQKLYLKLYYNVYGEFNHIWGTDTEFDIYSDTMTFEVYELMKDSLFEGADLTTVNGFTNFILKKAEVNLSLPQIDDSYLASLGSVSSFSLSGQTRIVSDKSAVLLYLLRLVSTACKNSTFRSQLMTLTGGYTAMLEQFLVAAGNNGEDIICSLAELCTPKKYGCEEIFSAETMNKLDVKNVEYTSYWSKADAEAVSTDVEGFITDICSLTGVDGVGELIESAIGENLYTNAILNTIVLELRGILSDMIPLLELIKVDISSWNAVTENYNWGFTDGSKSGFLNGIIKVFSPFEPVLKWVLCSGDISIFNGNITAKGYDGYRNGFIPLLEAIGCRSTDIVSPAQFNSDAQYLGTSAMLKDIAVPILNLLERVYQEPIDTLMEILPNVVYFAESGMLQKTIQNAMQSAFVLLDIARPLYAVDLEIIKNLTLEGLIEKFTEDSEQTFTTGILSQISFLSLLNGQLQQFTSVNGKTAYRAMSRSSDMLTIFLRAVVNIVFAGSNEESISLLVTAGNSVSGSLKKIISAILSGLNTIYESENGTDKVLHLIYLVYNIGSGAIGGDYTVFSDLIARWEFVIDYLSEDNNKYIEDFAKDIIDVLSNNTVGATNTQSTNIEDAYTISSTLCVKNISSEKSYTDGSMPSYIDSYIKEYNATRQLEDSASGKLYIDIDEDNITNLSQSGIYITSCIDAFKGKKLSNSLGLAATGSFTPSDSVTVTSEKGRQYTYSLITSGQGSMTETANGMKLNIIKMSELSGELPEVGDSVKLNVVLSSSCIGLNDSTYNNYSYITLEIATVSKGELRTALKSPVGKGAAYIEDSYKAFDAAYDNGETAEKNVVATQVEIDTATESINTAYASLRFNEQIQGKFATLFGLYYAQSDSVNNNNYKAIKAALLDLKSEFTQNSIPQKKMTGNEDIQKYSEIGTEYSTYINTKGYESFEQASLSYPVRKGTEKDKIKQSTDRYTADKETLNQVVDKLDIILTGSDFSTLVGSKVDLGVLLEENVSKLLYNDNMITTLVKSIYPTVCNLVTGLIDENAVFNLKSTDLNLGNKNTTDNSAQSNSQTDNNGENAEKNVKVTELKFGDMINSIAKTMLKDYEICLYPDDLATVLEKQNSIAYQSAITQLEKAGKDWRYVDWNMIKWDVSDIDSFVTAFGDVLSGVKPVIEAVLTDKSYSHSQIVYSLLSLANVELSLSASGVGAYDKVLLPIMELITDGKASYTYKGVKYNSLMKASDYNQLTEISDMTAHILYPILSSLEEKLTNAPVKTVLELIPNICLSMSYSIPEDLLASLATDIGFAVGVDFYGTLVDAELSFDVMSLLRDSLGLKLDMTSISGFANDLCKLLGNDITVANTSDELVGSLGTLLKKDSMSSRKERYYLSANTGDVLLYLIRYATKDDGDGSLVDTVLKLLDVQLDNEEIVGKIAKGIIDNPDMFVTAVAELLVQYEYGFKKIFAKTARVGTVEYSEYFTQEYASAIYDRIDEFADEICILLGVEPIGQTIKTALSDGLYTNKNLTSVITTLSSLMESFDKDKKFRELLGLNTDSWDGIVEGYDWGFTDGDKDGFIDALCTALDPIVSLVRFMLAGNDYYLFNRQVRLKGYLGYTNGVIAILEALGCNSEDIVSGSLYYSDISRDRSNAIKDILTPVLNLLERIYESPISTILEIVPNIAYFISSGSLSNAIDNALVSVYAIIDTIRPIYDIDLNFDFKSLIETGITTTVNDLISQYNLTLPKKFSLNTFMTGRIVNRTTVQSSIQTRVLLYERSENTLTQLLRYLLDVMFYGNNPNEIKSLVISKSENAETNKLICKIIDELNNIYKQEDGKDKILGILYYVFTVADDYFDGGINDVESIWTCVADVLSKSDKLYVVNFAFAIFPELMDVLGEDSPIDIPEKSLSFIQKIINFFSNFFAKIKSLFI